MKHKVNIGGKNEYDIVLTKAQVYHIHSALCFHMTTKASEAMNKDYTHSHTSLEADQENINQLRQTQLMFFNLITSDRKTSVTIAKD